PSRQPAWRSAVAARGNRFGDPQIPLPRSHGLRVLTPHHARDLSKMIQIMRRPGRQMLTEGDASEIGVAACSLEIRVGQLQRPEAFEACAPEISEGVEELGESFAVRGFELRGPVEHWKWDGVAMSQKMLHARNPVGAFPVNQVADDVERRPGSWSLCSVRP